MNRTTIAVAALLLAGCAAPAATPEPAPTVTVTTAPEPAPTVTVTADPEPTDLPAEAIQLGMDMAWQEMDAESRDLMCTAFTVDPDWAWDTFNEGADDGIDRAAFDQFFEEHC